MKTTGSKAFDISKQELMHWLHIVIITACAGALTSIGNMLVTGQFGGWQIFATMFGTALLDFARRFTADTTETV